MTPTIRLPGFTTPLPPPSLIPPPPAHPRAIPRTLRLVPPSLL
jgi:hypothetical protein